LKLDPEKITFMNRMLSSTGRSISLTFALKAHFGLPRGRIPFGFNDGTGETGQVKTLPLF